MSLIASRPEPQNRLDGLAGDVVGPVGRDQRDARDARALLLDLGDAADGDVLHQRPVELRAIGEVIQGLREQLLRMDVGQAALAGLAATARRADRVVDEDVRHRFLR